MRTKPVTPMLAPEKGAVWSKFTKNKEPIEGRFLAGNSDYGYDGPSVAPQSIQEEQSAQRLYWHH